MTREDPVYFLADMHLKPLDAVNSRAREAAVRENEALARFLSHIDGRGKVLVLLGDAFNFWLERRGKIAGDYYASLSLFKLAADNGLEIHHVSGNRDFVVGEGLGFDPLSRYSGFLGFKSGFTVSRLTDFGIEPHGPRFRFHHGGKTVCCVHGDSFCRKDRAFMALRWLLRGPVGIRFARYAPWALLESLASRCQSRLGIMGKGRAGDLFDETLVKREFAMGADLLLCGHIHCGYERDVEVAGRRGRLVALPPWLEGWYGVLDGEGLRVEKFSA